VSYTSSSLYEYCCCKNERQTVSAKIHQTFAGQIIRFVLLFTCDL